LLVGAAHGYPSPPRLVVVLVLVDSLSTPCPDRALGRPRPLRHPILVVVLVVVVERPPKSNSTTTTRTG
jgi:hypothetical protein